MPKRTDIQKILIIGSGPIVIGQACEFDYSGTQACKALREEGYKVALLNSNPATIMTDPELADATYIEPVTAEVLEKVIAKERPQACLPTLGGQTALNVAFEAGKRGVFKKYNVELIGANEEAIARAENRQLFKDTMIKAGIDLPRSRTAHSLDEAKAALEFVNLPCVIRPAFTLGGTGGGIAYNIEEYQEIIKRGLDLSIVHEVLVEEYLLGWKEFELEVMRDTKDNVVIVCSIENFDPMGVHTGDSITVAPIQTLTDIEYQKMRRAAIAVIRAIGVETGGSNIQFALNPKDGRMVVIEMNPRVSRSSALASKATGFPIAKIAAKLAVGYTLDEIPNDITKVTPASFEPAIDYCVVKIPRFTFEKFPQADPTLTTSMKSVGEVMAIGRTFKEALLKGIRALEIGKAGFHSLVPDEKTSKEALIEKVKQGLITPTDKRLFYIADAFRLGLSVAEVEELSYVDRWFLNNIKEVIDFEKGLKKKPLSGDTLLHAKKLGFSDKYLAQLTGVTEEKVRLQRDEEKIEPVYKLVDTCAAEFQAHTPYYYSTYETECEARISDKKKVMILGGGPNRIGQGIEFDYCCVHAAISLKEEHVEVIMVNCNPETVSTDYDTSDKLYFEPITIEDVLAIVKKEKPYGVVLQFGGQTPLNLALGLEKEGVNILGTKAKYIDIAEDRDKFRDLLDECDLRQAESGIAHSMEEAKKIVAKLGFPVMVRPSYVLGGRAMEIVYDEATLELFIKEALSYSMNQTILLDKFLEDAIEVDADVIGDGTHFCIGGILEHIEEAGIHSGDSAMCLPSFSLSEKVLCKVREASIKLAKALKIVGLMNIQFAIKNEQVYIIEVNPRASRTIPFISKAIGVPLAKLAAKVMIGKKLTDLGFLTEVIPPYMSVKESVFPFNRFLGVDTMLGPEMRSTGEVMGIDKDFGKAYLKSQIAAYQFLPKAGNVFISVKDRDKKAIVPIAQMLEKLGFNIFSTQGTAAVLKEKAITVKVLPKVFEGRPNILDYLKNKDVQLIINTPSGRLPRKDEIVIRSTATLYGIPVITTLAGAIASTQAIEALQKEESAVENVQRYHTLIKKPRA
ncbi:MAG: carbamoyl-phosphate synthase large subunit [Candidatus Omnitrophota bacterium]